MIDTPPQFSARERDQPGGFTGERDVFDTWFTSSLSPQIVNGWPLAQEPALPMDIRPQAHDIIRTWAFYTIAKSILHGATIPWRNVLVSGWILDPDRRKMSKSVGNVVTPLQYLERYTADGVRYWATSARLGADTAFDESVLKVGKRLVTKLYNAGKFVLGLEGSVGRIDAELDRSFVSELRSLAAEATRRLDEYDHAGALQAIESFFFATFTDSYIELTKHRARSEDDPVGAASARAGLRTGLNWLIRLFAPVLPFITEEIWSWSFAAETGHRSIHRAPWPEPHDLDDVPRPRHATSLAVAAAALGAIHKARTLAGQSLGTPIEHFELKCSAEDSSIVGGVAGDVAAAGRVAELTLAVEEEAR
jgi:valyl-tRNA synthetase